MIDRVADFPAELARTRRFTTGGPTHITPSGDGATARFLRDRALYELDLATTREHLLADDVDAFHGPALIRGGALWTLTGGLRRHPTSGPVTRLRSDPTGRLLAYAVNSTLFVRAIAPDRPPFSAHTDHPPGLPDAKRPLGSAGAERPLGSAGAERPLGSAGAEREPGSAGAERELGSAGAERELGSAGAERELGSAGAERELGSAGEDFVWSPDGSRLLVTLRDYTDVPRRRLDGRLAPAADGSAVPYTAAGEPLPRITLAVVGLGGERVETLVGEYLVRAGWDALGPYAVVLSRDQRTLRLLAIDPATGAATTGHEQGGEPWVHVVPGLPARRADGTVVAHVDRGDTRHLTIGGVPVTPAGLQVREVLSAGEDVLFTASTEPGSLYLWSYREQLQRVSSEPGAVRDGQFVHFAAPGRITAVREGKRPVAVHSGVDGGRLRAYRKGVKRAALFLPAGHRAGVSLPVLLDPYGGPSRQRVTAVPDWRDRLSQWFADQGFGVLVADGAGTPGGGPRDERRLHGDLYTEPLADQIRSLHEAAALHPDLDLSRVGIRGWSFGGSLALAAVLRHPDVFHCAVAGAAVTDQRLFHAEWRERYLGDPARFPARYDAGDLTRDAPRLSRPLLLMHGLADTTVLPVHTTRMADALRGAGRPFDLRLFPGIGHSAIGSPATSEILGAQLAFLSHHLRRSS